MDILSTILYTHPLYTHSNVLIEVSPLSHGAIAAAEEGEEVARKESVQLQEQVVHSHV